MASILLVDDDKSILTLLHAALANSGHELVLALGGKEALKIIENRQFDLIISDLQMPEVDGIHVLNTTKKMYPDTEVLILTAYASIKTAVRAIKSGAFEYLSKPVDIKELRHKVDKALEHRELKMQIEKKQQEIDEHHEMIERDLQMAEQVQRSLVPRPVKNDFVDIGVEFLPMMGVGGDFADIYFKNDQYCYLTIVDVTGHGITAALLVNRLYHELRKFVRDGLSPKEILKDVNDFILEIFSRTGMFLTMFSCVIDRKKRKCTYSGAAHPSVLLWKKKDSTFQQLQAQNIIIGFERSENNGYEQNEIDLDPGDKLVLYTDGLIEIEESEKNPIGIEGLIEALNRRIKSNPKKIAEQVVKDLKCQSRVRDDIMLMIAEVK